MYKGGSKYANNVFEYFTKVFKFSTICFFFIVLTQVENTGLPHHWNVRVFGGRRVEHFFFGALGRELGAPHTLEIRRVRLGITANVNYYVYTAREQFIIDTVIIYLPARVSWCTISSTWVSSP